MEEICRSAIREHALRHAPGRPIILVRPAPVKARCIAGNAIAYTVTHVLVEWEAAGEYQVRWEASWLVKRGPHGS
jgi:hypothetical protein